MDKNELVNKICAIEGLTNDEKSTLIELLRKQKKYGLVWEDKPEDVEERLREELPVLIEDTSKAIISTDTDAPNHILIEGDNLEALTALAYTHAGKVDVIYIDPPYNTGKKDFVYNDNFVDAEDCFRHSKWLSFMNKRLRIAKQLLSDKGVIFISIGDDEFANLKLLCDSIFLENNFIENYIWESTFRPDNSSPILRRNAEFVLCYAKTKDNIEYFRGVVSKTEGMASLSKSKEKKRELVFPENSVKTTLSDGVYHKGIKNNGNELPWELLNDAEVKDGVFITELKLKGHSYWGTQKKILNELANGTEIWIKAESFVPYYKKDKDSISRPNKILSPEIVNDYLYANTQINQFFPKGTFNNPKPTTLVEFLCNFTDNKNSTILDFFAGSGTTLHATMQLNAEDGGHRKCILVTNNENNICENVTYVRNKRVIQGYTTPKGENVPGFTSNTLRYYRTDFVPREKTQKNMRALVVAATDMLCIKNDIYTETHEIGGAKMRPSLARHFKNGYKEMLIIYDDRAIPYIVDKLKDIDVKEPIMVYVFSPNDYPYTDEFFEVADKVKLCALPAAIYETYCKVLKRPKPHFLDEEKEKMVEAEKEDELDELFTTIDEEGGEA
jgi:adenine-specific DNA-methyltransferase